MKEYRDNNNDKLNEYKANTKEQTHENKTNNTLIAIDTTPTNYLNTLV